MLPVNIQDHDRVLSKPEGWDDSVSGECKPLKIRDRSDSGVEWMESEWKPSPEELAAMNAGRSVLLAVFGNEHPPVSLSVGGVVAEAVPVADRLDATAESVADRVLDQFCIMKPGETLVCEWERPMRAEAERAMRSALGHAAKSAGIAVIILPYGMRAARTPKQ